MFLTMPFLEGFSFLFLLLGLFFFTGVHTKYRNKKVRFMHERETDSKMSNVRRGDKLRRRMTRNIEF